MATHSSILAWRIQWTEETGVYVYRVAKNRTRLKPLSSSCSIACVSSILNENEQASYPPT